MILFLSSIAPALIIMFIIYKQDTQKEPISMLLKAFFGGFLSIIITYAIALPLGELMGFIPSGFLQSFYNAFFCAAIPEEFAKWIIFYWLIKKAKDFDQYYDGILYAIFISMGFALVENVMYVMQSGMSVAIARAITAVPGHMLFAVPMGYYLSLAKFKEGKDAAKYVKLSLAVPILLHGIYDFILMYFSAKAEVNPLLAGVLVLLFVAFDIYMWQLGVRKIKEHLAADSKNISETPEV